MFGHFLWEDVEDMLREQEQEEIERLKNQPPGKIEVEERQEDKPKGEN